MQNFFVRLCMELDMQKFLLLKFQVKWKTSMYGTNKYEEKKESSKAHSQNDENDKKKIVRYLVQ